MTCSKRSKNQAPKKHRGNFPSWELGPITRWLSQEGPPNRPFQPLFWPISMTTGRLAWRRVFKLNKNVVYFYCESILFNTLHQCHCTWLLLDSGLIKCLSVIKWYVEIICLARLSNTFLCLHNLSHIQPSTQTPATISSEIINVQTMRNKRAAPSSEHDALKVEYMKGFPIFATTDLMSVQAFDPILSTSPGSRRRFPAHAKRVAVAWSWIMKNGGFHFYHSIRWVIVSQ